MNLIRQLRVEIDQFAKALKQPGSFGQNLLIRSTGSTVAYLIGFLLSPIIARIYLPEVYGQFAVFNALVASLSVITTLNFINAFVLPKSINHFIPLAQLTLMVIVVMTVFLFAAVSICGREVLDLFNIAELGNLIFLLPLFTFFTALVRYIDFWNVRETEYRTAAKAKVISIISSKLFTILLGVITKGSVSGFILGDLSSRPIQVVALLSRSVRREWKRVRQVSWPRVRWAAREYRDYPLYNMPANGLTVLAAQLPVYLLSYYYQIESTGHFTLAYSMTAAPIQVLGLSIASVYYQKAAQAAQTDAEKVRILTRKLFNRLILLGAVPFGLLVTFGREIFMVVFGSNWETAGTFASYMAFMAFCNFISVSFTSLYRVFRREKLQFLINLAGSILLCLGMFVALRFETEYYLVVAFSAISAVVYLYSIGMAFRLIGINPFKSLLSMVGSIGLVVMVLQLLFR